jgi:hypothetical protein
MALAGVWVLALVTCFAWRIGFALELEWMEGGSLHQALRLQQGLAIYPEPSAQFVPFLYTPLYPAVLAALGVVLPLDFVLARAISVASVVAIALGLWKLVGDEGKPRAHQAAAVGLWCSGYVFGFRWYDVARADSLFLALLLWGLVLLRGAKGRPGQAVLAGVLVALAFWTKQTAAVFVVASGLAALLVAPRELLWFALSVAVIDGGGVLLGQRLTGGQLWVYIYELHQTHAFNAERFTRKTWGMFLHAGPFVVVMLVSRFVMQARWMSPRTGWQGRAYWAILTAAALLVSALGYSTQWAEPNAFMPGICLGSAFVAVMLPVGPGEATALGLVSAQLIFSLALEPRYQPIQDRGLAGLADSYSLQDPWRTLPTAGERERASALREELVARAGPVLALQRPWWSVLAGGSGHVGTMGLHDVPRAQQRAIEREITAQVAAGGYVAVYLDGDPPAWLRPALQRRYDVARSAQGEARVLPLTGYMSEAGMVTPWRGPQRTYVPRP